MEDIDFVSAGAARTARWRAGIKHRKLPETDDLDRAIARAFATFIAVYERSDILERQQAAAGMKALVVRALTESGYCSEEVQRRAENRLYYLQMTAKYPNATAKQRRQWELGPPPDDWIDEHDVSDPDDDLNQSAWPYPHQDEGAFDDD